MKKLLKTIFKVSDSKKDMYVLDMKTVLDLIHSDTKLKRQYDIETSTFNFRVTLVVIVVDINYIKTQ